MKTRCLIELPAQEDEWLRFMYGEEPSDRKSAAAIVWSLEHEAMLAGWPRDAYVGSERDLKARFQVSRTVLRQAIRIVDLHGSMHMRRGREGGLHLARASVESAAAALATYLWATGCTLPELAQTELEARRYLDEIPPDALMSRLLDHTVRLFRAGDAGPVSSPARGALIAARLLSQNNPIPEHGLALGSEADLIERFCSSRATLRQALRVLDDLGMLRVRRGRGGGYVLTRPSALGVIRQVFALLASWRLSLSELVATTWALNLTSLRLCARNMQRMSAETRSQRCDQLAAGFVDSQEPRRWTALQQQLAQTAASKLVTMLLFSCVAYQGRLGVTTVAPWATIDSYLREQEDCIVHALKESDPDAAEDAQRRAQHRISQLLNAPELVPGIRHEPGGKSSEAR